MLPSVETCRLVDFPNLMGRDLSLFAGKVERAGGKAYIQVHPWYDIFKGKNIFRHPLFFRRDREELVQNCSENDLPLIFFEEYDQIDNLKERLKGQAGTFYQVPTIISDSLPVGHIITQPNIVHNLTQAGVRQLEIGGQYLAFAQAEKCLSRDTEYHLFWFAQRMPEFTSEYPEARKWLKEGLIPMGCAGIAIMRFMNRGFDVSISPASSPNIIMLPEEYNYQVNRQPATQKDWEGFL